MWNCLGLGSFFSILVFSAVANLLSCDCLGSTGLVRNSNVLPWLRAAELLH